MRMHTSTEAEKVFKIVDSSFQPCINGFATDVFDGPFGVKNRIHSLKMA